MNGDEYPPFTDPRIPMLRDALKGVSNAYGCFAGCTGALPDAPTDGSGHTPACRTARDALDESMPLADDLPACGDPTCPCQDGDLCHHLDDPVSGTKAMKRPGVRNG